MGAPRVRMRGAPPERPCSIHHPVPADTTEEPTVTTAIPGPRHRAERSRSRVRLRPPRGRRGAALAAGALAIAAVAGLQAGGTFALWSATAPVTAATITSGTTGLTVNGQAAATLIGLDATKLGPGSAVATSMTLANTGTTPLSVAASNGVVTADTKGLAAELTVRLVALPPASCSPSASGGVVGRIAGFSSAAAPVTLAAGATATVCLVVALDADAPAAAQGGATSFRLTFTGAQVAP